MKPLLAALVLAAAPAALVAPLALARDQPSFDCATAGSVIERTICGNDALVALDRTLTASYAQLMAKLDRPAKQHLLWDERRWLLGNTRACIAKFGDIGFCLKVRYERRIARLKALAEGGYPFVSEQAVVRDGKVGNVFYRIDVAWPRFDGRSADFSRLNADFADSVRASVEEMVPDLSTAEKLAQQEWVFDQSFTLQRPSRDTVAISLSYSLLGREGPPGLSGRFGRLVDLRTGKALAPDEVFGPGDGWLEALAAPVRADLEQRFALNPGAGKSIAPDKLAGLLRSPDRYHYGRDGLELIFNPDELVPGSGFGLITIKIPYEALKPYFRTDGPLGGR